jgi:hypothetical protein
MTGSIYSSGGVLGQVAGMTGEAVPTEIQQSAGGGGASMLSQLKGFGDSAFGSLSSMNPSTARLMSAGLTAKNISTKPQAAAPASWACKPDSPPQDWRVKVSVAAKSDILYTYSETKLLTPILTTGGVIFPITPVIQMTHTAKYSTGSLTHSNYAMHFYEGSEIGQININGEFPIQNIAEGQYLLAAIYFFRAATKMYWGQDDWAGTPPPMLFLSGYGSHYFPNVPCVITQFTHTMPDDKDFIEIPTPGGAGGTTRLPTQSQIQINLQPIYSRSAITKFNLDSFANGDMLNGGFV